MYTFWTLTRVLEAVGNNEFTSKMICCAVGSHSALMGGLRELVYSLSWKVLLLCVGWTLIGEGRLDKLATERQWTNCCQSAILDAIHCVDENNKWGVFVILKISFRLTKLINMKGVSCKYNFITCENEFFFTSNQSNIL